MYVVSSNLSIKGQVTSRKVVRGERGLGPGEFVGYVVGEGGVRIERVEPFDAAYHAAISEGLEEWASPEDDEAFGDL